MGVAQLPGCCDHTGGQPAQHLTAIASRCPAPQLCRFKQRCAEPGTRQMQGGGQPGKTASDNTNIKTLFAAKPGIIRQWRH